MPQHAQAREVKTAIPLPLPAIAEFCRRWGVREFALFGSILHPERFRPDSDVDVLVTLAPGVRYGFFGIGRMEEELKDLLGYEVEIVTRRGVESAGRRFRDEILQTAEVVYAE